MAPTLNQDNPTTLVCDTVPSLGQPCSVWTGCELGSYCDAGTCVPQIETGSCATYEVCALTSRCDWAIKECVPRLADGQPCNGAEECLSGACRESQGGRPIPVERLTCVGIFD